MSWTVARIASGVEKQWMSSPASLPTISAPRILPGVLADDLRAQDPPPPGVREHLHVAVVRLHQDRLAVVAEGMARGREFGPPLQEVALAPADSPELRVGEYHAQQHRVVQGLQAPHPCAVARGQLPLLYGEVDDLVRAAAVAGRVDVRRARLLPPIGEDPAAGLRPDSRRGERKPRRVGLAAERVEQVVSLPAEGLSLVPERDGHAVSQGADCRDLRACDALYPLVHKRLPHNAGGLLRMLPQEAGSALDDAYPRADAAEELGELAGDDAAA